jgi:hypothetical protein
MKLCLEDINVSKSNGLLEKDSRRTGETVNSICKGPTNYHGKAEGRISSSSDENMTQDDSELAAEKNRLLND